MNRLHFLTALKRSARYLAPAFLIPLILSIALELRRDSRNIDSWLLGLAGNAPLLLADDFHDRTRDADSISYEEELLNRDRFNRYTRNNQAAWVYTVVEKAGRLYFTAPTVTDEEARQQERWYFHPYEDAPEEFFTALRTGEPQFITYKDQWGTFRTVILPLRSPGGYRYAACVDVNLGKYFLRLLRKGITDFILLLIIFLLVIVYISLLTRETAPGKSPGRHVLLSRKELQQIIDRQTNHLQEMREKEQARNIQFLNALYASQMGLFSFNMKTGDLVHVYNNTIPETLGFQHDQYKMNLMWMVRNIGEPERLEEYERIIEDFRLRKTAQETVDVHMKNVTGGKTWFRLHLALQKGTAPEDDTLLVLAQEIEDVKIREKKLIKQAHTDTLTGLYNRSYCEQYFRTLREHIRKSDLPLVLCFIDINGLKTVNDNLGHNAGDKLLTDFTSLLRSSTREYDISARLGGDEFLLICPRTGKVDFEEMWRRIIRNTEEFNRSMDRDYLISFSHGCCLVDRITPETDFPTLLAEADRLMYMEKRNMKGRGVRVLRG